MDCERQPRTKKFCQEQEQNLHQQALEKIIDIHSDGTIDWYRVVLTILKNDPQAILNAFPQEPKVLTTEEKIEEERKQHENSSGKQISKPNINMPR